MCCFTGHVSDVSGTNIFARVNADREYLVYEITFSSDEDTAMILPIPVASGATEDAVEFVALDDYPDFFRDSLRLIFSVCGAPDCSEASKGRN